MRKKSELKIEFEHSMANVTYTASFAGGGIDIDVCAVNKANILFKPLQLRIGPAIIQKTTLLLPLPVRMRLNLKMYH